MVVLAVVQPTVILSGFEAATHDAPTNHGSKMQACFVFAQDKRQVEVGKEPSGILDVVVLGDVVFQKILGMGDRFDVGLGFKFFERDSTSDWWLGSARK